MSSVREKNQKIYKHYQLIRPQGCGVNVDVTKIDKMLKFNYLQKSPQRLTQDQQKMLNYNYFSNSLWLLEASQNKKILKKESKLLFQSPSKKKSQYFYKQATRLPSLSVDQVSAHNLISECTLYKKDVHKSSNEMLNLQIAINDKADKILNKLQPEVLLKQKEHRKDYLKLQSTEYIHEFLVQQRNESKVDMNSLSPQEKLSTRYEHKLLQPEYYNQLILEQRRKQCKKESEFIRVQRYGNQRRYEKQLNLTQYIGYS